MARHQNHSRKPWREEDVCREEREHKDPDRVDPSPHQSIEAARRLGVGRPARLHYGFGTVPLMSIRRSRELMSINPFGDDNGSFSS